MASCSLGASNMKLSKLDFGRATVGVAISHKSREAFRSCGSALETELTTKETKSLNLSSQLTPNSSEIESLVTEISNTTSISEFDLKLGGFRLYVRRDLTEKNKATHQPLPAPPPPAASLAITVKTTTDASDLNGSVSTSLALSKQVPSSGGIKTFLDRAADEGLMILQSPREMSNYKGKAHPPQCKEKQIVKEGQVLCFIEQLGGELPIETDISGEVIRILRDDGEPVGYGDALIAILPSFPGIKKLQ
ncbi:hypothetical protein OIU79_008029 [Salix purpurea]|uniref:Lipoyl-binding domain-containing protein n=1 Tax=Salix purpurea TaxID=77065 RepID=A0A9Q0THE1_SALPP|nr:hypothetical protein OIU79_008029 [Salix purpurea]